MKYSLAHLSDDSLDRGLEQSTADNRSTTAWQLAHIAESDARRRYVPKGYPSMFSYCVGALRLSEDAAYTRIRAARAARQFPAIFDAVADGRLHLCAVVELAPYLTPENAEELLAAAQHRTKRDIRLLLAQRFPRADMPTRVYVLSTPACQGELAPAPVVLTRTEHGTGRDARQVAPAPVGVAAPWPSLTPLSSQRFGLQFTVGQSVHDKLRYAQTLLGHAVPTGNLAEVFERALDALIVQLEKRKFGATTKPRPQRSSADPRHVPARVKCAVWERDGGQCTFVADGGQRCPAQTRLEYDHVDPVALGGEATVDGIRLRCRAHNQYEAECVFGAGFMEAKREAARLAAVERAEARRAAVESRERAAAEARVRATAERAEKLARQAAEQDPERSVIPWLRRLGCSADEARRAAARCEAIPDAPLEDQLRFALSGLAPPHRRVAASAV